MGTIEDVQVVQGVTKYHFRQDSRLREPGVRFEAWIRENDLALCKRPTNEYWDQINRYGIKNMLRD